MNGQRPEEANPGFPVSNEIINVLDQGEERYRAIFTAARDGIVLIDLDKDPGRIVDCNPEFEKQTGRSLSELKQLRIWQIRPAAKVDAARRKFFEIREKGIGGANDLEFEKPNGEITFIEFTSQVLVIGDHRYSQSLCRDVTEKRKVESELDQYRNRLEKMVDERTLQLRNTIAQLKSSVAECRSGSEKLEQDEKRIRKLTKAYIKAQEEERQWISIELHDRVIQELINIAHQISECEAAVVEKPQRMKIHGLQKSIDVAIAETRRLMKTLYPATLARYGLVSLLEQELTELEEETKCRCILNSNLKRKLDHEVETTLYRIGHEALRNIRRHGHNVQNVVVSVIENGNTVELNVSDDGHGFDVSRTLASKRPGGLESMQRRAELLDGVCTIASQLGTGTSIKTCLPFYTA